MWNDLLTTGTECQMFFLKSFKIAKVYSQRNHTPEHMLLHLAQNNQLDSQCTIQPKAK